MNSPNLNTGSCKVLSAAASEGVPAPEGGTRMTDDWEPQQLCCPSSGLDHRLLGREGVRVVGEERHLIIGSGEPTHEAQSPAGGPCSMGTKK